MHILWVAQEGMQEDMIIQFQSLSQALERGLRRTCLPRGRVTEKKDADKKISKPPTTTNYLSHHDRKNMTPRRKFTSFYPLMKCLLQDTSN